MGEKNWMVPLRYSLAVAFRAATAKPLNFRSVIADATVQSKNINWPNGWKTDFQGAGASGKAGRAVRKQVAPQSVACSSKRALQRNQIYAYGEKHHHS